MSLEDETGIANIIVRPDARKRGLGSLLTQDIVDILRALGCSTLLLIATELGAIRSDTSPRTSAPPGRSTSLAIRPERILLSEQDSVAPASMNCIRGRVRTSTYNGPETRHEVEVSNGGILTAVMLNGSGRSFEPGQAVDCTFAPDSVVILED